MLRRCRESCRDRGHLSCYARVDPSQTASRPPRQPFRRNLARAHLSHHRERREVGMSQEVADWSLKRVIESILFASQRPVSTKDLHGILKSAAEMEKADPQAANFSAI